VPLPADVRARMLEPEDVADIVAFLAALRQRVRIDRIVVTRNYIPLRLRDHLPSTPERPRPGPASQAR
jgi:hypothetical protein